jgi:hypothetical protein
MIRNDGAFPFCGRGDVNLYAVFAETMRGQLGPSGRMGAVLPSGIATDDTTKHFFQSVMSSGSLISVFDFENKGLFASVHSSYKFCLFTVGGTQVTSDRAEFVFFAHSVNDLGDRDKRFALSSSEIALLNPNTRTCPVMQYQKDVSLCLFVAARLKPLVLQSLEEGNPWGFAYKEVCHMAHDSASFIDAKQSLTAPEGYLRLYEAKMMHQFDHRWMGYEEAVISSELKEDAHYSVKPRYYVESTCVEQAIRSDWKNSWQIGWRAIARATDERTVIFSAVPYAGMSNSLPMAVIRSDDPWLLLANLNSFMADYGARQRLPGANMTMNTLRQVPVLSPYCFREECAWTGLSNDQRFSLRDWLLPRVLELTYTACDLEAFAADCGRSGPPFRWDEERRFLLRCELDAAFFHLYLGPQSEWQQQPEALTRAFPTPRHAVSYIMDTFPIVKRKDESKHGHYRTQATILQIYDALGEAMQSGVPYKTSLNPSPADPACCHPPKN